MSVKAVIDLSENLYHTLSSHGLSKEVISKESRKLLALKCYKEKLLSLGKAAELSGLGLMDFVEFLGDNEVDVIDYDDEQLSREFEGARKLRKAKKR